MEFQEGGLKREGCFLVGVIVICHNAIKAHQINCLTSTELQHPPTPQPWKLQDKSCPI